MVISRCDEELLSAEVDGEVLGMSVEQGICYGLNGSASHVWKMIAAPRRLDEICASLTAQYDVDLATCRADVTSLLDKLDAASLIVVAS